MVEGERDCALVDVGESAEEPPRLTESRAPAWDGREAGADVALGLSLPVGPLPRGGLFAGGRFKAARRLAFSSSNSATRCSRACWERKEKERKSANRLK
jgi:hypothetical protein